MNKKNKILFIILILNLILISATYFWAKEKEKNLTIFYLNLRNDLVSDGGEFPVVKEATGKISQLLSSLKENGNDQELLRELGDSYLIKKDLDNAEKYYLEALNLGNDRVVLRQLAVLYKEKQDYKNAVKYYENLISFFSDDAGGYLSLTDLYWYNLKDRSKAIEICQRAVFNNPEDLNLKLILADYYRQNGEIQKAVITYQSVLAVNPQEPTAQRELEKLLSKD